MDSAIHSYLNAREEKKQLNAKLNEAKVKVAMLDSAIFEMLDGKLGAKHKTSTGAVASIVNRKRVAPVQELLAGELLEKYLDAAEEPNGEEAAMFIYDNRPVSEEPRLSVRAPAKKKRRN